MVGKKGVRGVFEARCGEMLAILKKLRLIRTMFDEISKYLPFSYERLSSQRFDYDEEDRDLISHVPFRYGHSLPRRGNHIRYSLIHHHICTVHMQH